MTRCRVLWRTQVKLCTSLHIGPLLASCPAASILASGPLTLGCEGLQRLKTITRLHKTIGGRAGVAPCLHEVEA